MLFADFIDDVGGFMTNWFVWVPMILVLLGLVGVMIFMRMKKKDEDE